ASHAVYGTAHRWILRTLSRHLLDQETIEAHPWLDFIESGLRDPASFEVRIRQAVEPAYAEHFYSTQERLERRTNALTPVVLPEPVQTPTWAIGDRMRDTVTGAIREIDRLDLDNNRVHLKDDSPNTYETLRRLSSARYERLA